MKDLNFVRNIFNTIETIWAILFVLSIFALLFGGLEHNHYGDVIGFNYYFIFGLGLVVVSWYVGHILIRLNKIIFTRFIAATENILEITQMLEKKLSDSNS